jgi:hypothetical protein
VRGHAIGFRKRPVSREYHGLRGPFGA